MSYSVGQKVLYVRKYGGDTTVEIAKIGKKWVYFGSKRFDAETLKVDGGGYDSPGFIVVDVEAYRVEQYNHRVWEAFQQVVRDTRSTEVPTAMYIKEAAQALGLGAKLQAELDRK